MLGGGAGARGRCGGGGGVRVLGEGCGCWGKVRVLGEGCGCWGRGSGKRGRNESAMQPYLSADYFRQILGDILQADLTD